MKKTAPIRDLMMVCMYVCMKLDAISIVNNKTLPDVSGNILAAAAASRFMTASTRPTEKLPSEDTTTKGDVKAPSFEQATHTAWPMVRISVLYSSGVDTQVAFCENKSDH